MRLLDRLLDRYLIACLVMSSFHAVVLKCLCSQVLDVSDVTRHKNYRA